MALNAGYFVSRVLDIVENSGTKIAILDASAACHMPDVLEMPYHAPILGQILRRGRDTPSVWPGHLPGGDVWGLRLCA